MSKGLTQLHSHSGLEGALGFPKHIVLIDARFSHLFVGGMCIPFKHNGIEYCKVETLQFVKNGGIFKNLSA